MKKVFVLIVVFITLIVSSMSMTSCSMFNFGSSSHECSTENIPLLDLKEARKNLLELGYTVNVYDRGEFIDCGDGAISASNYNSFIDIIEFETEELAKLYCAVKMHTDAGIPQAKAELELCKYLLKHCSDSMSLSDIKTY